MKYLSNESEVFIDDENSIPTLQTHLQTLIGKTKTFPPSCWDWGIILDQGLSTFCNLIPTSDTQAKKDHLCHCIQGKGS